MYRLAGEALRFGAVGVLATATHALIFLFALKLVAPQLANLAGFVTAFAISYFGHRYFSFRASGADANHWQTGWRFVLISLSGYALNAGFVAFSETVLKAPETAFWFIFFATPALTFLALKFWVFRHR